MKALRKKYGKKPYHETRFSVRRTSRIVDRIIRERAALSAHKRAIETGQSVQAFRESYPEPVLIRTPEEPSDFEFIPANGFSSIIRALKVEKENTHG